MTDAPKLIWVWVDYDGNWDGTWLGHSEHIEPHRLPDAKYVRATDYDALAAKLKEVEAERDRLETYIEPVDDAVVAISDLLIGRDQLHEDDIELGDGNSPEDFRLSVENVLRVVRRIIDRAEAAEAALVAAYRLALGDAEQGAKTVNGWTGKPHQSNMDYGPNIVVKVAATIRALPTPTAEELMARIKEGLTDG